MPKNEAERSAQERYKVPIAKAGLDYIARPMNREKFNENFDKVDFSRKDTSLKVASRKGGKTTYVYGRKNNGDE